MTDRPRRREAALGLVGAVTVGALAASGMTAARADEPAYPTWREVQRARTDAGAAAAEASRITLLVSGLQDRADEAGRTAMIAAERFHRARLVEDAARDRLAELAGQADAAQALARTSRMRAGLLAASVARRGDAGVELLLDADSADDLLHRLTTVSQLSAQSAAVYGRALADRREAESAGAQADVAATALADAAERSQAALEEAQRASAAATEQVDAEQQHADRLLAQLAELRGTSVRLAAAYVDGVRADRAAAAPAAAPTPSAPLSAPVTASAAPSPLRTVSAAPVASVTAPSRTPPATTAPSASTAPIAAPVPTASAAPEPPAPAPVAPRVTAAPIASAPNSQQAASAVAFARDQIGDPYRFGAAGPDGWDCSGLTMQAYASVGLGIGGHSATAQYRLAAAEGRLVPYAQATVGDLVFYTDGTSGDMYHVAIYSGGGTMIEAPYPGTRVREVAVRAADRVATVARPTG